MRQQDCLTTFVRHLLNRRRYTAILAATGGFKPSNPCSFEQVAEHFADEDDKFNWNNGKARNTIEVW